MERSEGTSWNVLTTHYFLSALFLLELPELDVFVGAPTNQGFSIFADMQGPDSAAVSLDGVDKR